MFPKEQILCRLFQTQIWGKLCQYVDKWSGDENCCRLLVGMQKLPQDQFKEAMSLLEDSKITDAKTIVQLRKQLAEEFRKQLMIGTPTNADEATLQKLATQIKEKKVTVKLFLRHTLHAKLYLLYRQDTKIHIRILQ
jgi:hypothetical protein